MTRHSLAVVCKAAKDGGTQVEVAQLEFVNAPTPVGSLPRPTIGVDSICTPDETGRLDGADPCWVA